MRSVETLQTFEKCRWAALAREDVCWATYYTARQLLDQDIEGDFVECGVFAGVQVALLYRAIIDSQKPIRKIHLFDTFSGIPSSTIEDGEAGVNMPGKAICSLQETQTYLNDWGVDMSTLVFHVGRLEETLPKLSPFPIALLRVDCDLYSGVKAVLEHLYPSLVSRGICILDDYAFQGCREAFMQYFGPAAIDPGPGTISPLTWQRR